MVQKSRKVRMCVRRESRWRLWCVLTRTHTHTHTHTHTNTIDCVLTRTHGHTHTHNQPLVNTRVNTHMRSSSKYVYIWIQTMTHTHLRHRSVCLWVHHCKKMRKITHTCGTGASASEFIFHSRGIDGLLRQWFRSSLKRCSFIIETVFIRHWTRIHWFIAAAWMAFFDSHRIHAWNGAHLTHYLKRCLFDSSLKRCAFDSFTSGSPIHEPIGDSFAAVAHVIDDEHMLQIPPGGESTVSRLIQSKSCEGGGRWHAVTW